MNHFSSIFINCHTKLAIELSKPKKSTLGLLHIYILVLFKISQLWNIYNYSKQEYYGTCMFTMVLVTVASINLTKFL